MTEMQQFDILKLITEQVERYSQDKAAYWLEAQASWTPEVRTWLCQTLIELQRTDLMYNRVAKVVCYSGAPSNNKPVLAFGEVRPGGGRFVEHTNRLVVSLDGRSVHKYVDVPGLTSVLRFEDSAKETRVA